VFEDPFAGDDVGPTGQGTRSQVLLVMKASYSSSMARHQDRSARVARTEVGTG
jgi:hypothetical protein